MKPASLESVLVGFGHAAKAFHLTGIADLAAHGLASGSVAVVDPLLGESAALPRGVRAYSRLPKLEVDNTVVHVCTPPNTHAAVVREAYALGYRRFMVEKPLATSVDDANELVNLAERGGAEILVVTNWSVSTVATELRKRIRERGVAAVREATLVQHKPRFERTMSSGAHHSAFEVEMPHLVALSLFLVPEALQLIAAQSTDLVLGGVRYNGMASARIRLRASSGTPICLTSDLTAPWRERAVHIDWADDTKVIGFLPCDSTDLHGQLFDWDADGRCTGRQILRDDTVVQFFRTAYAYFAGTGPKPISDVHFGCAIVEIISAAKECASSGKHSIEQLFEVKNGARLNHSPVAGGPSDGEPVA